MAKPHLLHNFATMKKIFVIAIIVILALNFYCIVTHPGDERTPYSEFCDRIGIVPMKEYQDSDFGYTVNYPCFFQKEEKQEDDFPGHARFCYTQDANIVLESYVTRNRSLDIRSCADSLAAKLHAEKRMQTSNPKDSEISSFILLGPVYENGVRIDGYSHYDKFIKSGKMLFVYSLTYPDSYKPALPRLFQLIDDWKVLGAY